ncbi:MAG: mechanosensitive ion channel, partial [Bacteroidaceae bacterium]|nr:mechanosensitive ion channel [Bacteroidaceae bacterium]
MVFLQTPTINIDAEELARVNDSIKVATYGALEQLRTNPQGFMEDLIQTAIQFGLKLLAAIIIYSLGVWIIRRIKKALTRIFARRNTEGTLASFITSFVSIALTAILIIISISTLGINTTSIAALLAAGGMAIGMALSGTISNFAGGIMLLVFKPFKAGDFISAQGYSGR